MKGSDFQRKKHDIPELKCNIKISLLDCFTSQSNLEQGKTHLSQSDDH